MPLEDAEEELREVHPNRRLGIFFVGAGSMVALILVMVFLLLSGSNRQGDAGGTVESKGKVESKGEAESKGEVVAKGKGGPEPAVVDPVELNDRDLKLLQGRWRARAVYSANGRGDYTAVLGVPLTIEGKKARKMDLGKADFVATIQRLDATKKPKEIDFQVEGGSLKGKTLALLYIVSDSQFELFQPLPAGATPSKEFQFGQRIWKGDDGFLFYYSRAN